MADKSGRRDYAAERGRIVDFLTSFYVEDEEQMGRKVFVYADHIHRLAMRQQVSLAIDVEHVRSHDAELAESVVGNAKRYHQLFAAAVDHMIGEELAGTEPPVKDSLDAFIYQRLASARGSAAAVAADGGGGQQADARKAYPPELLRRFEVNFRCGVASSPDLWDKPLSVRDVRARHVGKLVTLRGIVIRATEVKPMAAVATYTCDTCANETYQPVAGAAFTPATDCPSSDCAEAKAGGRLVMQVRGSKFVKFQEIKIQEHSDQVPVGSIPRSLTIHVRGELTRQCAPGDHVLATGIFLPQHKAGFKQMTAGLLSEVYLDAQHLSNVNQAAADEELADSDALTEAEVEAASQPRFYDRLAYSIAPEIYGHEDVKKSLLLQLVGGVDNNAAGMKIRGAVNVCLMGDPGVAKSQLLGYMARLAARSQYTTGRGSSGVGLTAAVMRDPVTGEMALEGGALVLADRGICCIDEFDKMLDADRTAIHEVMEQQTISIAKAGIMTTLNARVAILAAANPAFGRYNPRASIEHNIQLPAALLSRFDLLWLIQDKQDRENDVRLARHITHVHAHCEQPPLAAGDSDGAAAQGPLDMRTIRRYISLCKRKNPMVPQELTQQLVDMYVGLRREARNNKDTTFTSPRVLLAVVRMATALARLRLADTVDANDIGEACRLMEASKESLRPEKEARRQRQRPVDRLFAILRKLCDTARRPAAAAIYDEVRDGDEADENEAGRRAEISLADASKEAERHGFDESVLRECLDTYENKAGVLMVDRKRGKIVFPLN